MARRRSPRSHLPPRGRGLLHPCGVRNDKLCWPSRASAVQRSPKFISGRTEREINFALRGGAAGLPLRPGHFDPPRSGRHHRGMEEPVQERVSDQLTVLVSAACAGATSQSMLQQCPPAPSSRSFFLLRPGTVIPNFIPGILRPSNRNGTTQYPRDENRKITSITSNRCTADPHHT